MFTTGIVGAFQIVNIELLSFNIEKMRKGIINRIVCISIFNIHFTNMFPCDFTILICNNSEKQAQQLHDSTIEEILSKRIDITNH